MRGQDATDPRRRLIAAAASLERTRREVASAAKAAKAAGVPVREIAEILGFKTRRSVYELIRRGR